MISNKMHSPDQVIAKISLKFKSCHWDRLGETAGKFSLVDCRKKYSETRLLRHPDFQFTIILSFYRLYSYICFFYVSLSHNLFLNGFNFDLINLSKSTFKSIAISSKHD